MKVYKIVIVVIVFLYSCVCNNDGHEYITLINKSKSAISCQEFWYKKISEADSVFQCNLVTDYIISSDSTKKFISINSFWEIDFKAIPYIQFLILDGELFKQYIDSPCDTIRKYVPVLHVYRLTQSDLEKTNWTITYPPTEAMKGIKMYPPYETHR